MNKQIDENRESLQLKGKLNALSSIIRLGHESFEKKNLKEWTIHVVNNSVLAVPYNRSCLIDLRNHNVKILGISGQAQVNANSEFCQNVLILGEALRALPSNKAVVLDNELINSLTTNSPEAHAALEYLQTNSETIIAVPLTAQSKDDSNLTVNEFIWLVEFSRKDQGMIAPALLSLLKQHYNESLFFVLTDRRQNMLKQVMDKKQWRRPERIVLIIILLFLICCVIIRIPQKVSAEFEIVPAQASIAYSPFDGVIEKCYFKSGDLVQSGDLILQYDTQERAFNLNAAQNEYNRITAQHDLVQRMSFMDITKRGNVKILELQQKKAEIEIARNQWFLSQSKLFADKNGILDIGEADKLEGRAVRSGEKLFEILHTDSLIAQISLDERNSAVLGDKLGVTLYLHTRPELPIEGKVLSISPKPVLNERKLFCFTIKSELTSPPGELLCGMRGIARISGPKVSLGYYLFRNIVLWYRQF